MEVYIFMEASKVAFDDLPEGPVKINDMLQAKDFAEDFIIYWVLYFYEGFDTDSPHSRKPDQSSSGFIVLLNMPVVCFMDHFENVHGVSFSSTDPKYQNWVKHITSCQNNYLSEKYFRNELFRFRNTKNGTMGALTLKPQMEIRTKDKSSQKLEYIVSISYTLEYGEDFKTKETCSTKKVVQLGQEVSFTELWRYLKADFLSLIGSLSYDITRLWYIVRDEDTKSKKK